MADQNKAATPAAQWRERGEADPFAGQYDCERAKLCMGNLSDDELANAVFMHDHRSFDLAAMQRGEPSSIALLTAAKERIRWLSRALVAATTLAATPAVPVPALTRYSPTADVCQNEAIADMEVDNACGEYVLATDVQALLAAETAWRDTTIVDLSTKLSIAEALAASQSVPAPDAPTDEATALRKALMAARDLHISTLRTPVHFNAMTNLIDKALSPKESK